MNTTIVIGIIGLVLALGVAFVLMKTAGSKPKAASGEPDIFTAQPLLNKAEMALFTVLETLSRDIFGPDIRVFVQVSYGEFLKANTRSAFAKVNQKRADFVIAKIDGTILRVVEYQGSGHFGSSKTARERAEASDAMKRIANASAGLTMVDIPAKYSDDQVRNLLGLPS